jgi:hypothetical protein
MGNQLVATCSREIARNIRSVRIVISNSYNHLQQNTSPKQYFPSSQHTFVDHEGKMKLIVDVPSAPSLENNKALMAYYVNETCKLVANKTKTSISAVMTSPFTTTGPVKTHKLDLTQNPSLKKYI